MARKGILGKKVGMTQIFTDNGELVPVTVVEATPNVVMQLKTVENDGYEAVQLGWEICAKYYQTNLPRVMQKRQIQLLNVTFANSAMLKWETTN